VVVKTASAENSLDCGKQMHYPGLKTYESNILVFKLYCQYNLYSNYIDVDSLLSSPFVNQ